MPLGPGKYDDLCTFVRETAHAQGVVVIVINGDMGSGFSCQADLIVTAALPDMLETMAGQIRAAAPPETRAATGILRVKPIDDEPPGA